MLQDDRAAAGQAVDRADVVQIGGQLGRIVVWEVEQFFGVGAMWEEVRKPSASLRTLTPNRRYTQRVPGTLPCA
jgi:hypothetical protein